MGQSPLAPLNIKSPSGAPLTEGERTKLDRVERADFLVKTLLEDLDLMPVVLKGLLDSQDPKKVCSLMKEGFELKIAEMRDAHAKLQSELSTKVNDGAMQQSEMLMRIQNSDGKIRSMQWFLSNIS